MPHVRPLTPDDRPRWDAFVRRHPHGTPFHLLAWRDCIAATFGYEPRYLVAESGGELRGVLPLFLVENLAVKRALISTPFAVYGGALADADDARDALRDAVRELGESLNVQYVDLRNADAAQCLGFAPVDRYVTFTQPLSPQTDEELLTALPKKTRNMVRKSLKPGFTARRTRDTTVFERLHSQNLRRLGTPCFPPRHFARLVEAFGDEVDLREVSLPDGTVVATSFNFLYNGSFHTYYAASDERHLNLAPNNFMYFDQLLWAGQNQFHTYDFGRSKKGAGTVDFKRHWITSMRELPYEMLLVRRREMPNFSPANPKFDLAIRVWQRLPLPVTRLLGPRVVRLFP